MFFALDPAKEVLHREYLKSAFISAYAAIALIRSVFFRDIGLVNEFHTVAAATIGF